ncbi:hypothetical protein SBADM41S_06920 [Streptomyces badius]
MAASAGRPLGGGGTVGRPAAVLAVAAGAPRPGAEPLAPVAGAAAGIAAPVVGVSARRAVFVRTWFALGRGATGRSRAGRGPAGGAGTGRLRAGRGVRRDPQQGVHGGDRPGQREEEERRVQQARVHEGPGGHGRRRPHSGQDRGARHGDADPAQPVRDVVVRVAQRGTRRAAAGDQDQGAVGECHRGQGRERRPRGAAGRGGRQDQRAGGRQGESGELRTGRAEPEARGVPVMEEEAGEARHQGRREAARERGPRRRGRT